MILKNQNYIMILLNFLKAFGFWWKLIKIPILIDYGKEEKENNVLFASNNMKENYYKKIKQMEKQKLVYY